MTVPWRAAVAGEQVAALVDEIPQIEYIKEERQPGPKHIAEVADLVSDQVKCIFGGAGGKFLPDEMRRGAKGNMPACELADVLVKITELWWAGQEEEARAVHRRLLPLINLDPLFRADAVEHVRHQSQTSRFVIATS